MWVLAEGSRRILDDPARIGPLLDDAAALGVSALFVQVYRGGRAWFDSGLADATPYRDSKAASGMDSLSLLVSRAHDDMTLGTVGRTTHMQLAAEWFIPGTEPTEFCPIHNPFERMFTSAPGALGRVGGRD